MLFDPNNPPPPNPFARTSYGDGSINTTVQPMGLNAGHQAGAMDGFLMELMKRKMQPSPRAAGPKAVNLGAVNKPEFKGSSQATNTYQGSQFGPTPAEFGKYQMNARGGWGTMVDPANIPVGLQDKIMGGFYGNIANWDSSNPSIMGPQQLSTGKYTNKASGAGSGGSGASIGPGGQTDPRAQPDERPDFYGLQRRAQEDAMRRRG